MNTNFIKLSYWFSSRPGNLAPGAIKLFAVFIIALVVLGIYSFLRSSKKQEMYRKIWGKIANFSVSNAVIGSILLFMFYENIPFLSARVLGLFWVLIMLIWLYFIFRKVKEIPLIKEKRKQEQEFKKYIP